MARARNIKPGLYKNEDLAECSIWARFVFPGLWMLADRDGRMEDRPKRIKAELLPFDNADVDQLLDELARYGFILRYEVDGQRYIQVLKFSEHQTPHVREQASTIPAPVETVPSTAKAVPRHDLDDGVSSPRSPDSLIPSLLIPDSLIPVEATPAPAKRKATAPATRLPADWLPTDGDTEFCKAERPDLRLTEVADRFRDYWHAMPGTKGQKADWNATWRNWVRNERRGVAQGPPPGATPKFDPIAYVNRNRIPP
ncbi:hypothetical protein HF313_15005 [Massilia atriviolacea]|uniref:DnaT DNA-binding domain-containing protein n=1 Tax=Massilia atriviolacea TaxID=2495579 RepID=A0A430HR67_9BURK|nr:hypothetical protein [Massilia atriviolacea]RSZ60021.1 hypothetical protein EJB06_07530 [Massilia atriviolacea]